MKMGLPPTALKARTGELTPPGITRLARSNKASEFGSVMAAFYPRKPSAPAMLQGRHDATRPPDRQRGVLRGLRGAGSASHAEPVGHDRADQLRAPRLGSGARSRRRDGQ